MRKSFKKTVLLCHMGDVCNFNVPKWAERIKIKGVADRPDEAEEGDITLATTLKEVGDVYLSMAAACLSQSHFLSSLPQNKEIVSIAVDNPREVIKKIEESF